MEKEIIRTITCPEDFCWLYFVGCLEMRLQTRTLSQEEFNQAMTFVHTGKFPPPHKVREWGPKPFEVIEKKYGVCTLRYMREHWHNDHKGETLVHVARIKTVPLLRGNPLLIRAESIQELKGGERLLIASNFHKYPLSPGDMVRIHGNVVAELM